MIIQKNSLFSLALIIVGPVILLIGEIGTAVSAEVIKIGYREQQSRHFTRRGHLLNNRARHPHNIKRLYPNGYRYHTPPRRYRYSCSYDRWGNSHPNYRYACDGIGRHYYVPKNFYRKNRHYRGHPYMRRQLKNFRRRWY